MAINLQDADGNDVDLANQDGGGDNKVLIELGGAVAPPPEPTRGYPTEEFRDYPVPAHFVRDFPSD